MTSDPKKLIAFSHIEKAAGTTLIHNLRYNFIGKYCDVRPMTIHKKYLKPRGNNYFINESKISFRPQDLKIILNLNPFIKVISGHSLKPSSELINQYPNISFITLLRNPTKRYISRFIYLKEKMGVKLDFEEFLTIPEEMNFQTKKIAAKNDLELAIRIIKKHFILVGIVEQFDEFILLLTNKLKKENYNPKYIIKNVASPSSFQENIYDKYRDIIINNNKTDLELYNYVKNVSLNNEKYNYGVNFQDDLANFKNNKYIKRHSLNSLFDYLIRKLYYDPLIGCIRKLNGMSYKGQY